MTDCVVDTSVILKWVIAERDSPLADAFLSNAIRVRMELCAIDLAMIESDNGIWKRFHRKLYSRATVLTAHYDLRKIPLDVLESYSLCERALEIACDYDIAVYDAHFVAAVESLDCDGITADEPLIAKVGKDFPSIQLLKNWQPSP